MTSRFFESMPYRVDEETGLINYDELELLASRFRPKILICGFSAYCRHYDFPRFRKIADSVGAILMCDMAHVAGLVAAGVHPSPFDLCDIVTTTTHKTLRGPRGSLIFFRNKYAERINTTIFPGLQGGPHNHTIAGISVALELASKEDFKAYQKQVVSNANAMASAFLSLSQTFLDELRGELPGHPEFLKSISSYKLVSGGTDNHCILVNIGPTGVTGSRVEPVCAAVKICLNKNTVPGDKSAINPSGLRIGSPALTTRGATEDDFALIASFIHRAIKIAIRIQSQGATRLVDFLQKISLDSEDIKKLKEDVTSLCSRLNPVPSLIV